MTTYADSDSTTVHASTPVGSRSSKPGNSRSNAKSSRPLSNCWSSTLVDHSTSMLTCSI